MKTFKVDEFRHLVNKTLDPSDETSHFALVDEFWAKRAEEEGWTPGQIARAAVAGYLERVLFDTGNYKGFRYADGNYGDSDSTARHYY